MEMVKFMMQVIGNCISSFWGVGGGLLSCLCVVVVFFVFLFVFFSMITFVIAGFYAFPCAELSVILHTDDFGCLLLHADVRGRLCLGGRCYFKHLQVLTSLIEIISTNYPPYQIINI